MSTTFQLEGRITHVGDVQTIGTNGFRKREFILDTEPPGAKWPNPIPFELHKEQCDILLAHGPASVRFAINGRPWKDRHFVTLKAFSVAIVNPDPGDGKPLPPFKTPDPQPPPERRGEVAGTDNDDLPF